MQDRLGSLFDEYRSINDRTVTFFLAQIIVGAICGILVGVQRGARILPTSPEAVVLNTLILTTKTLYFLYLIYVCPQVRS